MKLGLVLEGGASRTYFSCGVMDKLMQEKIWADYLIGASAGIANGISYASRQLGRNIELGTTYLHDKRYMGVRHWLNPHNRSYYNLRFVFGEVPEKWLPFDYDAFAAYPGEVIAVVTNMRTGKADYLPVPRRDHRLREVIASCALPLLFQPVEIDGVPYMDGGIADPVPVEQALQAGCDKLIVVVTRERGYRKTSEAGMRLATRCYRDYPAFVHTLEHRMEIYNRSHEQLYQLEREGKAFVIAPDSIDCKRTEGRPEVIRALYDQGFRTMQAQMPALRDYLQT